MNQTTTPTRPKRAWLWVLPVFLFVAAGSFVIAQNLINQQAVEAPALASQEALLDWLGLSVEQRQAVHDADPDFATEALTLTEQLLRDRTDLAATLRNPDADDDTIMAAFNRAMLTECALEQRVATHVLKLRPALDREQRQLLLGLVAEGLDKFAGRHLQP